MLLTERVYIVYYTCNVVSSCVNSKVNNCYWKYWMGHVACCPLLELLTWYHVMKPCLWNSCENQASSMGARSSNTLRWLHLRTGHQDTGPFSDQHDGMLHCLCALRTYEREIEQLSLYLCIHKPTADLFITAMLECLSCMDTSDN